MKKRVTQTNKFGIYSPITIKLLAVFVLVLFSLGTINAQSFILDIQGQTMSFTNAQRTIVTNTGNNGTNVNSVHKYSNVLTKDGVTIYALMTIKEKNNATITNFDDDAITGESTRFQPRIGTGSGGGYIVYELEFFNTADNESVFVYNYNMTGIDIDGNSSNNKEFVEVGGYTSYTVNNPTGLTISTNNSTGRTRFLGITTNLGGVTFDNSAAFIANFLNANNKISFALGQTGANTERFYSVQIGVAGGVFTNPTTINNPLPIAVDDVGTPINSADGGTAVNNVLDNDLFNGLPIVPSQVSISLVTAASHPGIVLNTSNGKVTVAPGTPGGTYTLVYKICMNSAPSDCDIATVTVKVLSADLVIEKTVNQNSVNAGTDILYTISVTNNGPTEAFDVIVTDVLSNNLENIIVTPNTGSWSAPAWSIGTLGLNQSVSMTISAKVSSSFSGLLPNTAVVGSSTTDPNPNNNTSTVNINVAALIGPTANDDNASTTLNTSVNINVLENDAAGTAALNPTTVSFVPGTQPNPTTQGTFTVNTMTGLVTFTPVTGFTGTVTVDYQVCDLNGLCDIATITVIVNTVAGPTANDDNATTNLNTPVDINVLTNDVAGATPLNPATVTFVPGTLPNPTTQGTFTANTTTGLVTFTPVTGFTGTVTIDYQVCDQNALCDIATITVIVNTVAGPEAINDNATTLINTPTTIDILANDLQGLAALDPTSVTFIDGTEPNPSTQGIFSVDPLTGIVTFTPVNSYVGTATIDYQVCDLNGLCDIATITVNIILGTGNLYPALGPGTLAFEDLWPGKGDYDFNDLVIDYQFEIISNASNFVEQVTATFVIRAFGASFENGFGFQLSGAINASDLNVTGFDLSENFITLAANGTEAGQSKPTIIVFDNAFAQMAHPGIGIGVNTELNAPYVQPVTLTVNIDFKPNTYTINQLDISNFNPFLIVNKNRSHEVHLPNYPPTDLVDMSLFGQWEDASNPATGKYYVTVNNLPWAINIYESFDYPIEKQDILWVHLKFAEWAMSGGALFPDWYKNLTGYRNNSLIYQVPAK
ncbi:MAG: LruC domain-containing protein [Bacteroidetes bacterium]|nr:LruC domain-containing protein [Bacteroidota bacterium]